MFLLVLAHLKTVVCVCLKVKKGRTLVIAALLGLPATAEVLRYMVLTEQRHTYSTCLYTFPTVAGTDLPTPKGWRVE